jgi:hypothetical protein
MVVCMMGALLAGVAGAQAISTTTVQGTVYLANGQPGTGTLVVSWPSFTTANGQLVVAGKMTVTIAPDGFVSVNLAPNQGATPAGLYYTAVYERDVWRDVRRAEFYRDAVDGIEPDDIDGECDGAAAVRDDCDGQPIDCDGGTRNVSLRGCALRGGSTASGSQGGTVFLYSGGRDGAGGRPDVCGGYAWAFHLDNVVINTTAATSATAQGVVAYRTQEMDLESLYFLGNSNQTGMTLDGTGNYTGGRFSTTQFTGFQTAVNAIGHQISNPATTDWMNASTFVRLHIDCPTSGGNPISGTYGINCSRAMETRLPAEMWRDARRHCTWERTRRTTRSLGCGTRTRRTRWWRMRAARTTTG